MSERLIYMPLGGAGEIGMNAYVFGWGAPGRERLLLIDLGVTFPNMDSAPGVDLIMPDISWLVERRERLDAIVISHAHEDHIGALGYLWPKLRVPVLARDFTARIARKKLMEAQQSTDAVQAVAPTPAAVTLGPFRLQFLPVSHSLPESSAILIETPAGRILHSGDFKIDLSPGVGEPFDARLFQAIGDKGVRAMTCDSTNVFVLHPGRSESALYPAFEQLIRGASGLVVATTFASHVARLRTLAHVGREAGRSICVIGRAMQSMLRTTMEAGLVADFPPIVSLEEAAEIPREHLMLLVTGSQGERRAAAAQLAQGPYLGFDLKEDDLFLFSSAIIPGNERDIFRVMNQLAARGVIVQDAAGGLYHVSGHANRPDLERMHDLVRPDIVIPMHGEARHLHAHALLARARGYRAAVAMNGTMLDLTQPEPRVVDQIEAGRLYLDGTQIYGALGGIVRDRLRLAINGLVTVTLIIDEEGLPIGDPWADLRGLPEQGRSGPLVPVLEEAMAQDLRLADRKLFESDERLTELLRRRVRSVALDEIGKKPEVQVIVSRLAEPE